ncbi:DUF2061 domain-containing protein [Bradyrhizobium sp. URHC0002]
MLSFVFTGSIKVVGAIADAEVITKMILYYLHERPGPSFAGTSKDKPVTAPSTT